MSVIVYILASEANSTRTHLVKALFDDPFFTVKIANIDAPASLQPKRGMSADQVLESYRVEWVLNDAATRYPNQRVLVVKDSSVSNSDPETIANIVRAAMSSGGWDILYLCSWLNNCDALSNTRAISGKTTIIVKTMSPHGVQAVLFTPRGRDIMLGRLPMKNGASFTPINKPLSIQLNEAVTNGWIDADWVYPNVLEYDITQAAKPGDYIKTMACSPKPDGTYRQVEPGTIVGPTITSPGVVPIPSVTVPGASTPGMNVPGVTTTPGVITPGVNVPASVPGTPAPSANIPGTPPTPTPPPRTGWSWWWIVLIIIVIIVIIWLIYLFVHRRGAAVTSVTSTVPYTSTPGPAPYLSSPGALFL